MYRRVLEVLKWTEVQTILKFAAEVSQLWFSAAASEELWICQCEAENLSFEDLEEPLPSAQSCYRRLKICKNSLIVLHADNSFQVFNCQNQTLGSSVPFPGNMFSDTTAAVLLSTHSLFLCGEGLSALLSLTTGALTKLPDMIVKRQSHSAIAVNRSVYAFGGDGDTTAERYSLHLAQWGKLPDMLTARSWFTACAHDKLIYLCGGFTTNCEVFDTTTVTFSPLPNSLESNNWTVSFIYKDELITVVVDRIHCMKGSFVSVSTHKLALIP